MKIKVALKRFLAGLGIGAGAAIPGVSGAAVAVIFHVYEDIIAAVNNFRKKFGWSIKVLLPILFGILIAVVACVILFSWAFEHAMFILICVFAGFLIGSFPGITDEVKGVEKTTWHHLLICIGSLVVVLMGCLSIIMGLQGNNIAQFFDTMPWWMYLVLIPVGCAAAVALTVPGLSGSLLLLILGFYRPLVDHATDWGKEMLGIGVAQSFEHTGQLLGTLGCFAIGCLIGVVLISKLMTLLLSKYRTQTFFLIIGFILGSIVVLFFNFDIFNYYRVWENAKLANSLNIHPSLPIYLEMPIGLVTIILCALGSYQLVRIGRKAN